MNRRERPIIFSGDMVRSIIDGRKTQTRRVMKPQPLNLPDGAYCDPYNGNYGFFTFWTTDNRMILDCGGNIPNAAHWKCPYGVPGDRLWVRETWLIDSGKHCTYRADDPNWPGETPQWKPSIHMPRRASRIVLEITNIRVERVRDITPQGVYHEGIRVFQRDDEDLPGSSKMTDAIYINSYIRLWDSINEKRGYGWITNPYVWVIGFRRCE